MQYAFQLDLFEERDPYAEFGEELMEQRKSLRKTQQRFFAEINAQGKEILKLHQEIESIRALLIVRIK